jgi:hypothetical protein
MTLLICSAFCYFVSASEFLPLICHHLTHPLRLFTVTTARSSQSLENDSSRHEGGEIFIKYSDNIKIDEKIDIKSVLKDRGCDNFFQVAPLHRNKFSCCC